MPTYSTKRRTTVDPRSLGCRCDECPLGRWYREKGTFTPVTPEGPEDAKYVAVGEMPGSYEVMNLRPFVGPSGQLLERTFNRLGVTRDEVLITNGILCRPPRNDIDLFNATYVAHLNEGIRARNKGKKPGEREQRILGPQEYCRPHVERIVNAAAQRGAIVFLLGKMGYWSVLGKRPKIKDVRGSFGEYVHMGEDKHGKPILATYEESAAELYQDAPRIRVCTSINPAFALKDGNAGYSEVLHRDIERGLRWYNGNLDWQDPWPTQVRSIRPDPRDLADWLRRPGWYVWDIETAPAYPDNKRKDLEDHVQDSRENKLRVLGIYDLARKEAVVIPWVSVDGTIGFAPGRATRDWPTRPVPWAPDGFGVHGWAPPSRNLLAPTIVDQTEAIRCERDPWWSPHSFYDFHYDEVGGDIIIRGLRDWFEDPNIAKGGHFSGYFDLGTMLRHLGPFEPRSLVDQILLSRVWNSELPRSLYFVGTMLTDVPAWKAAKDDRSVAREPRSQEELSRYNVTDLKVTAQTLPVLLRAGQPHWNVVDLDHKVQRICLEMHQVGIYVHEETRAEVEEETRAKITEEWRVIAEVAGADFNPRSTKQLGTLLYETWKYPVPHLTETGKPATNEDAIRKLLTTPGLLAHDHRLLLEALWRSRGLQKDLSDVLLPMRVRSKGGIVHEDGVLRPDYSAHIPATGRISAAGPNCFDGETEILTEQGWVRFDQLPRGLRVAQFWPSDDDRPSAVDFALPEEYVEAHFNGEMVHVRNNQVDLFMTPTHRCLLRTKNGRWRDYLGAAYPEAAQQYHTGRTTAKGCALTDDQIRFIVAFQADGTFRYAPTVDGAVEYGAGFGFKRERKIERMRALLQALDYRYTEGVESSGVTTFYTPYSRNPTLKHLIHSTLGPAKVFGPWILTMSGAQLDVFTDELWYWDGSFERKSHYSTSERRNADWVQAAFALAGRQRANLRAYDAPHLTRTNWQVDVSTKPYSWTTNRERTFVPWSGTVYCVSVPSSYIIVRRNGKVMVTGQTQNIRKRLRQIFRPRPGHIFLQADYDQIELRMMSAVAQVASYLKAFAKGDDPHAVTALLVYGEVFQKELDIYLKTKVKTARFQSLRRFAKTFVYAVLYGGGASTVYENVAKAVDDDGNLLFPDMGFKKVEDAVRAWMRNAPEVPLWWERTWRFCEVNGFVEEPIMGRRRHMPQFLRNEAVNLPIQGAAAIVMGLGLIALRAEFEPDAVEGLGIVNQMHDAVTVEVPESRAMELAPVVTKALTMEFPDKLPGMVFSATADPTIDWSERAWRAPGEPWNKAVAKARKAILDLRAPEAQARVAGVLETLDRLSPACMADQFKLHQLEGVLISAMKLDGKKV